MIYILWPKKRFSRWQPPLSWISEISIFGHVTVTGFNIWCSVPNFMKIARFFTEIWRFNDFQNGGRPPSWILHICIFVPWPLSACRYAYSLGSISDVVYQISSESDDFPLIRKNGGLDIRFYVRDPPKKHILGRNRVFWRILRQNPSRALGCSESKEPKKPQKTNTFWWAKSRMRGNTTPEQILTNFCTGVGVHDVINCADLYYDRLRGLGVAGDQILAFNIDFLRRPYNTLALPCECVIASPRKKLYRPMVRWCVMAGQDQSQRNW